MSHPQTLPVPAHAGNVHAAYSPKEAMKNTLTEAELRQLVSEGKTHKEIGRLIGRHTSNIASACAVLGIVSSNWRQGRPVKTPHDLSGYMADMRSGMTTREIATKRGLGESTVVQALRRAGLPTCARKLLRQDAEQQAA